MTKEEAYKVLDDTQNYLKYLDMEKFPRKLRKKMPYETVKALAVIEVALQVGFRLYKKKHMVDELKKLKQPNNTSRGKLVNHTIDDCIKVIESIK